MYIYDHQVRYRPDPAAYIIATLAAYRLPLIRGGRQAGNEHV